MKYRLAILLTIFSLSCILGSAMKSLKKIKRSYFWDDIKLMVFSRNFLKLIFKYEDECTIMEEFDGNMNEFRSLKLSIEAAGYLGNEPSWCERAKTIWNFHKLKFLTNKKIQDMEPNGHCVDSRLQEFHNTEFNIVKINEKPRIAINNAILGSRRNLLDEHAFENLAKTNNPENAEQDIQTQTKKKAINANGIIDKVTNNDVKEYLSKILGINRPGSELTQQ